jgi:hypothetical protein
MTVLSSSRSRQIDPRGHRFGAGLSVVLLLAGFATGNVIAIPAVGLALAISAVFGTRWSILGRPWPVVRRVLRIGPPRELESEYPPRFAQLLGTVGLALATVLVAFEVTAGAWLVAGAVAALQTVLAATGYCLGCRLYFLRWYAPALFDRFIAGTASTGERIARSA